MNGGKMSGKDAWWNAWHLPGTTREHREQKRRVRRNSRQDIREQARDGRGTTYERHHNGE